MMYYSCWRAKNPTDAHMTQDPGRKKGPVTLVIE